MVHLAFNRTAELARSFRELASFKIDVGIGAGVVFPALNLCRRIVLAPLTSVGRMALKAISLKAARLGSTGANVFWHFWIVQCLRGSLYGTLEMR